MYLNSNEAWVKAVPTKYQKISRAPKQLGSGEFQKPRGRPPKGMSWDSKVGKWKNDEKGGGAQEDEHQEDADEADADEEDADEEEAAQKATASKKRKAWSQKPRGRRQRGQRAS